MNGDDINDYLPSILNPRTVKKLNGELTLTQNSVVSRCSLSLKRKNGYLNVKKNLHKTFPLDKENQNNNSLTQEYSQINNVPKKIVVEEPSKIDEDLSWDFQHTENCQLNHKLINNKNVHKEKIKENSLGFSSIYDFLTDKNNIDLSPFSFGDIELPKRNEIAVQDKLTNVDNISLISLYSATDQVNNELESRISTVTYELNEEQTTSLSFGDFQGKENFQNIHELTKIQTKNVHKEKTIEDSLGFSAIDDLSTDKNNIDSSPFSFGDIELPKRDEITIQDKLTNVDNISLILYSATDQVNNELESRISTVTYELNEEQTISLSFGDFQHKENIQNIHELTKIQTKNVHKEKTIEDSFGLSAIDDLLTDRNNIGSSPFSFGDIELPKRDEIPIQDKFTNDDNISLISLSSATDLVDNELESSISTVSYELNEEQTISLSFGVNNCDTVNINTNNSYIKNIVVSHNDTKMNMLVHCDVVETNITEGTEVESSIFLAGELESSHISISSSDQEDLPSPPKKSAFNVNLEIKKKKASEENSKVLILNTDAIAKLSHVIVQPPNYKLVKRKFSDNNKLKNSGVKKLSGVKKEKPACSVNLQQKRIDSYLSNSADVIKVSEKTFVGVETEDVEFNDGQDMSKNLGVSDAVKTDRNGRAVCKLHRKENEASPRPIKVLPKRDASPKQSIKLSNSEAPSRGAPQSRIDSASSARSPRRNLESVQFNLPKSTSNRNSLSPRRIPHYKIVAGTHFAVDAFSYGEIPNVKHYFLTHFHSDHYSGLKKGFNKLLFCSKITADLCISRLGVNAKNIHVINCEETLTIEGVEVTAVDANHCPGALMLAFTLPNGRTLLHTGDFRASPLMESYPIFWNKDIHSIYLDTTYCNPRYDFPTQDQSLEMALYHLRQKKLELEKTGKKFSSILIVCGTYTIGKEKFFLGMARRVGCAVWACPEKDRVLQAVEGRSFSHAPPHSCQLHVVPMRDLTHEKLRSYLDSLQGTFSEVVAFKPSGWENGKNSTVEKNSVTIHGIPYSEHSSFSELIRFVKFLKPKQVVPTVDISGGIKTVQKYFPCPLVCKDDVQNQSKLTDYFSIHNRHLAPAIT